MNGFVVYFQYKFVMWVVAPTLTMSWLYDVCTMFVGIREYTNIHHRLGISFIYFFKLLRAFKINCLEQITTFYFCQIWSWIRSMFCGDVQISGTEFELVLVTMKKVEELTTNIDEIQLNKQLCNYLGKQFTKTRTVLERSFPSMSTLATTDQKKVLQEIYMMAKCGEALVQKCLCKESSWLDGAITLANVKEDVTEILLSLSWWTSVLKMTKADMGQVIQNTTKALKKHDHLLEKFLSASGSLQDAAKNDMEYLLAKLKEVKANHVDTSFTSPSGINNQEYILATYLLSQITGDVKDVTKEVDTELKKYNWLALLGEGAGGDVGKVMWLNKTCALKIIRIPNIEKEEKEVTILKRCHHPHIVKFFWYWEDTKSHIMMEWMPKNLYTHIKAQVQGKLGTPFKLHVAIDIMLQVANAMRYLHNEKIVHRDLKTSNILVEPIMGCSEGYLNVKLADFGTAKPYNMTETFSKQTPGQGTRVYAAPEIIFEKPMVDEELKSPNFPPKADVWSFAMVCSEILTGEPPFEGEKRATLCAKIVDENLRPPLPKNCPDYLRFCITSCWQTSPKDRPNFSSICKNFMLAKAMSLGVFPLDSCNYIFAQSHQRWNELKNRSNVGPSLPIENTNIFLEHHQASSSGEMGDHQDDGQKYYLIGTYFTFYTRLSREKITTTPRKKTGICCQDFEIQDDFKCLFEPLEISIMEGNCWHEPIDDTAYGCLIGIFVDSKHQENLKEKKIQVAQGGFIGETNVHSSAPRIKKYFWGIENSNISEDDWVASFYSGVESPSGYVYVYLEYGSNKPALISHLWHGDDLVLGNKITAQHVSRYVIGNQIFESGQHGDKHTTFAISISQSS